MRPDPSVARSRGSVTPLIALVVVATGGLCLGLGRLGGEAVAAARARTAADASALAGAAEGDEDDARRLAEANDGKLVSFEVEGPEVQVHVRVGEADALARAERTGGPSGFDVAGTVGVNGLVPELVAALARAEQLLGEPVPITSGFRSPESQRALWANRANNPFPVARPGTSMHERGMAIDVPRSFVARLLSVAVAVGLCQPLPRTDPVHFELC